MHPRLRFVVALYDWFARVHFGAYGLGLATGVAAVVALLINALLALPSWGLFLLGVSAFFLSLGTVGWVGSRRNPRPDPKPSPTASKQSGPARRVVRRPPPPPTVVTARPVPEKVPTSSLTPTSQRGEDARNAKAELGDLVAEGEGYADRLRALDLDPKDDGYQLEDEKLVKDAEAWLPRSAEVEDYWYAPAITSIARMMRSGMFDDSGSKNPVRRPVWRQKLVNRIEARLDDLRAHLK